MKQNKGLLFFSIALFIVILDQLTKYMIRTNLALGQSIPLIDGFFHLWFVKNTGAGFGILPNATTSLMWISVIVIGIILWYYDKAIEQRFTLITTALILGGTIGNFIDRAVLGYVVDFLDFYLVIGHYPTFNIADAAISVGALCLVGFLYYQDKVSAPKKKR